MRDTGFFDDGRPRELRKNELARLLTLRGEVDALVHLIRPLVPHDLSWRYYDKDAEELASYLGLDPDAPIWRSHRTGYATGELHTMLDAVQGAASRLPFDDRPWPPGVDEMARAISDKTLSARERSDARAVLGDLLEERGYTNVADVLRLNQPRIDLFVLPYLRGEFYVAPSKRRRR